MRPYLFAFIFSFIGYLAGAQEVFSEPDISRFHIDEEPTAELMENFIKNPPDDAEYEQLQKKNYNMQPIACYAAEHYPEKIDDIFNGGYRWIPRCLEWSLANKVPDFKELDKKYIQLSGVYNICGTIISDIGASMNSYFIKAGALPDFGKNNFNNSISAYENFLSRMDRWASQGIWEKEQYELLQSLKAKALPAISDYYRKQFNLTKSVANEDAEDLLKAVDMLYLNRGAACPYNKTPINKEIDEFLSNPDFSSLSNKVNKGCDNNVPTFSNDEWVAAMLQTAVVWHRPIDDIKKLISYLSDNISLSILREPIHQAAPYYHEALAFLLKKSPEAVNQANEFGKTALMYATQYNNLESIKLLISYKANLNATTNMPEDGCNQNFSLQAGNRTALMYAAWYSSTEIIKFMLDAGADKKALDSQNKNACNYLEKNNLLNESQKVSMKALLCE